VKLFSFGLAILNFSLGGALAMVIDGIRVEADSALSRDQISELIRDFTKTWAWEGKHPGRIELSREGQTIVVRIYGKPYTTIVPLNKTQGGVMP
jgi:hypothetical protein